MDKRETKVIRRILGWHIGDKCAVQLKTKKVYGTVKDIGIAHYIGVITGIEFANALAQRKIPPRPRGRPRKDTQYALVEYETKSKIPHRQEIPLDELLEDDREIDEGKNEGIN